MLLNSQPIEGGAKVHLAATNATPIAPSGVQARLKLMFVPPAADRIKPPAATKTVALDANGHPVAGVWGAAASVLDEVWHNEESRFSGLNSRGVSLLSALSLILSVLGFFSSSVLDRSANGLTGSEKTTAQVGIYLALGFFVLAAFVIVFGVLMPSGRVIFGENAITSGPDELTKELIDETAFREYGGIYSTLANRSSRKAFWLSWAYLLFALAVTCSAVATVVVIQRF
ncbi:MAG TPA: hypothetical protein VJ851_18950 [Jatrophihabitans sp.]|nr:hypothetical protein [Jatrophihabitans sp.]